jgi:hypothetical protein
MLFNVDDVRCYVRERTESCRKTAEEAYRARRKICASDSGDPYANQEAEKVRLTKHRFQAPMDHHS